MEKILLFYKYVSVPDIEKIVNWQKEFAQSLQLTGRIIIAPEGINGTVAGTEINLELYKKAMIKHPLFATIDFKESDGNRTCFPRLRVIIRETIVNFGRGQQASLDHTGEYLSPEEVHTLLETNNDNLVVLDTRNNFESRIGKFSNAIAPDIDHFRDLPDYIDNNLDLFKDKEVLMYCTGGVRCERATAYLNEKKVAKKVMHIKGGIHRYVLEYPDGFFRGQNYVFDDRVAIRVTDDIITNCDFCNTLCDEYTHCINASCNKMIIACNNCRNTYDNCCSDNCKSAIASGATHSRPPFKSVKLLNCKHTR